MGEPLELVRRGFCGEVGEFGGVGFELFVDTEALIEFLFDDDDVEVGIVVDLPEVSFESVEDGAVVGDVFDDDEALGGEEGGGLEKLREVGGGEVFGVDALWVDGRIGEGVREGLVEVGASAEENLEHRLILGLIGGFGNFCGLLGDKKTPRVLVSN